MFGRIVKRSYSTQWWQRLPEVSKEASDAKIKEQQRLVNETVNVVKAQIEDEASWIGSSMKRAAADGRNRFTLYYYQLNTKGPDHIHNATIARKLNDLFNPTLKFTDNSNPLIARHLSIEWTFPDTIEWSGPSNSCAKK